jgi:hypothetical protein
MKAIIDIPADVNQTLTILKAQLGFKNKSETITYVVNKFKEYDLEPEVRPEYAKKLLENAQKKGISVNSVADLRKRYE